MAMAMLPIAFIPPPPPPLASISSADRKPPPLIQAVSSDVTPTFSGQQVKHKRDSKGGPKRKKYCTEDERLGVEKERRTEINKVFKELGEMCHDYLQCEKSQNKLTILHQAVDVISNLQSQVLVLAYVRHAI